MEDLQKGFIVPILIAIIALLVIGGSIYIYEIKKVEIPTSPDVQVQQSNPNPQAAAQIKNEISAPVINNTNPSTGSVSTKLTKPPVSRPSVKVIYPNMGEVLNNDPGRDNIATIRWTTSDFGSMNITIRLLNKSGDLIKTIASNIPNNGNYNWKADKTIASGEYKIEVISSQSMIDVGSESIIRDLSDGTFVISTRQIIPGKTFVTLVSPNGGEVFGVGSKMIIKWSSLGEKPTSATISLRSNARCPYGYVCTPLPNSFANIAEISGNDLNKGEYEWTVSKSGVDSHGNGYLIGIMIIKDDLGNASYDDSDSRFDIN